MPKPDEPARKPEEFTLAEPRTAQEWESYFDLRWRVLREPWGQPRGTERDDLDAESFHLILRDSAGAVVAVGRLHLDRKSTRLNSSHPSISYAVFCLKKKKK